MPRRGKNQKIISLPWDGEHLLFLPGRLGDHGFLGRGFGLRRGWRSLPGRTASCRCVCLGRSGRGGCCRHWPRRDGFLRLAARLLSFFTFLLLFLLDLL